MFRVTEIFDSIQGEGPITGTPCTFVRLQGCNVGCLWCDTKESWSMDGGAEICLSDLVNITQTHIVFTGGEPLLQFGNNAEETMHGLSALCINDSHVHILSLETSGTVPLVNTTWWGRISAYFDTVVISPKRHACDCDNLRMYALSHMCDKIYYKFVIDNELDLIWAIATVNTLGLLDHHSHVYLQPCSMNPVATKLVYNACLKYGYNMSVQTHKLINVR